MSIDFFSICSDSGDETEEAGRTDSVCKSLWAVLELLGGRFLSSVTITRDVYEHVGHTYSCVHQTDNDHFKDTGKVHLERGGYEFFYITLLFS